MLPIVEPPALLRRTEKEPCPVTPPGDECAVVASGEGCEIVLPLEENKTEATPPGLSTTAPTAPSAPENPPHIRRAGDRQRGSRRVA
jgi:hypothetical protein